VDESISVSKVYRADLNSLPEADICTVAAAHELKVESPPARPTTVMATQVLSLVKWITAQPAKNDAVMLASKIPQGR